MRSVAFGVGLLVVLGGAGVLFGQQPAGSAAWGQPGKIESVAPGVWRITFGTPERFTPGTVREKEPDLEGLQALPVPGDLPFQLEEIRGDVRASRTVVRVPCDEPDSQIYGFGLDPKMYQHKELRETLAVCSEPVGQTGASHGPVPFYVSTRGYGVWVDTARVPYVHVTRLGAKAALTTEMDANAAAKAAGEPEPSRPQLDEAVRKAGGRPEVVFDIPHAQGVVVYVFGGPTMREAVQRYNLFSGGGCMPPLWGLGVKYRFYTGADAATVLRLAQAIRQRNIPCDMIGLEPGWQSAAYPCSLAWSPERFPDSQGVIDQLRGMAFQVNLWEHAYLCSGSPLFAPLRDRAGDFLVWGGLVIDFADPSTLAIFADYHERNFVDHGITGFKLDECDRQAPWDAKPFNFPYATSFPSGIDGEVMSQLYGYFYQRSLYSVFKKKNLRTWGDVRATTSLAAPLPFNLYSDAYEFGDYLRQTINASFTGLLWSPEFRGAGSYEEVLNRLALSSLADQMCFNNWALPHPLWEQYDNDKNGRHELLSPADQDRVAADIRRIIEQRMRLVPYLYAAFFRYRHEGLPPVRSLLLDFPDDIALRTVDDAYLFGDALMVAPFVGGAAERDVYFPAGCRWVDFRTNQVYEGGTKHHITGRPGEAPIFVKENTILPLAEPLQHLGADTVFDLTVRVYGDHPAPLTLIEDDGETFNYEKGEFSRVTLTWRDGKGSEDRLGTYAKPRYRIRRWEKVTLKPAPRAP